MPSPVAYAAASCLGCRRRPCSAVLVLQLRIGIELRHMGGGRRFARGLDGHPGRQFAGHGITTRIQGIGVATGDAFPVGNLVDLEHADGIHLAAGGADRPGDEAFYRFRRVVHAACSPLRPLWRSSASTEGSRPRKATNSSMGSRLPPRARILSRKALPVSALKMPSSSKREKASADSTSAHL